MLRYFWVGVPDVSRQPPGDGYSENVAGFASRGKGAAAVTQVSSYIYNYGGQYLDKGMATDKPFNRTSRSIDLSNRHRTPSEPWISRPCGRSP
jgi:hypothetical protein